LTGHASLVGKRVGGCLYVHRNALDLIDEQVLAPVRNFEQLVSELPWNVAKVSGQQVSFLVYENFDQAAFPALLQAIAPTSCPAVRRASELSSSSANSGRCTESQSRFGHCSNIAIVDLDKP
jgi:hypothetical protein